MKETKGKSTKNRLFIADEVNQTRFLTNLFQSSTEYSIIGKDLEGEILLWNEGARRIYGYDPEEVVGKANSCILHTEEDLKAGKPRQMMEDALREGKWEGTINRRRKSGEIFSARVVITPRCDDAGKPVGFLLISKDVTNEVCFSDQIRKAKLFDSAIELQQRNEELQNEVAEREMAEEKLRSAHEMMESQVTERTAELAAAVEILSVEIAERRSMEERLITETTERLQAMEALREKEQLLIQQSRLAALGEMIGNIAHQWRQPLNTLGLTIQQLRLFYDLGGFDREFLDNSVTKSMDLIHHMSRTIDDFRNYFNPDKEKVDFRLHEVLANTLSLMEGSLDHQRISIEVDVKDDPVIRGYPNEFSQVLLNILINAREALSEREVKNPKVMIAIGRERERAVVTIADNAGGISEEIMGRIFDPYFTTKGPQAGTGVGLFMSKTIIEKNMGGSLAARNTADGAEFRIEV